MRIVSLLPSATEIVSALGLGGDLVGVTHECDWPPEAASRRVVTASTLPAGAAPAEVDGLVAASLAGGAPIYRLDTEAIRDLRPDLVLTQDVCAVCALPAGHVTEALAKLGSPAEAVSLNPSTLGDVLDSILQVGRVTGTLPRAEAVVSALGARMAAVTVAVAGLPRPRTFALEWSDPPFNAGHWVPEMIEMAGGESVLGRPATPSVRVTWEQIAVAAPQIVVFMPCGYGLEAAAREAKGLVGRPELASVRSLFAVDANAYFSRPGPRLIDGIEVVAEALHPEVFGGGIRRDPTRIREVW
jgi:iron complex transport system substrate-binding protein